MLHMYTYMYTFVLHIHTHICMKVVVQVKRGKKNDGKKQKFIYYLFWSLSLTFCDFIKVY